MLKDFEILFFIIFALASLVLFALSVLAFSLPFIFKKGNLTATAPGSLVQKSYKKDAKHLGSRSSGTPFIYTIKHETKGVYVYRVNGKKYIKRTTMYAKKHEMSYSCLICYLKAFPKISYIKEYHYDSMPMFGIQGILLAFWAVIMSAIAIGSFLY